MIRIGIFRASQRAVAATTNQSQPKAKVPNGLQAWEIMRKIQTLFWIGWPRYLSRDRLGLLSSSLAVLVIESITRQQS